MAKRARKNMEPVFEDVRLSPGPWIAIAAGCVVLFFGVATAFAVGIYSGGWHGTMSRWAAGAFPFPAAVVDGRTVWVRDVLSDTDAFVAYRDAHPEIRAADLTREQIQTNVLSRLVHEAWIDQAAERRGIVVTDEEVDAEYAAAAPTDVDEMLRQFDWSEAEFKRKVVRVYLLQQKLRSAIGDAQYEREAARAAEKAVYFMKR